MPIRILENIKGSELPAEWRERNLADPDEAVRLFGVLGREPGMEGLLVWGGKGPAGHVASGARLRSSSLWP